jgi:hypothetical protein
MKAKCFTTLRNAGIGLLHSINMENAQTELRMGSVHGLSGKFVIVLYRDDRQNDRTINAESRSSEHK